MSDHTTFGRTQEEQAEHQMVDYGVRMRKERDAAVAVIATLRERLATLRRAAGHVLQAPYVESVRTMASKHLTEEEVTLRNLLIELENEERHRDAGQQQLEPEVPS